ncbi:MAG: amino acid ABC transporter permease [Chloroflexi bacterium]|nr:amino acid ABC transporter permease [Chloroflexota bacterium]
MPDIELLPPDNRPSRDIAGKALALSGVSNLPAWAVIILIAGLIAAAVIVTNAEYTSILLILSSGIALTLYVTFFAYTLALIFGLVAGLMRVSRNPILYTIATLYVEVIRGIPLLVLILYFFFVIAPFLANSVPDQFAFVFRDEALEGIIALSVGYGAYLAEVYRAGIESIPRGQMEAARSLGMSYPSAMRYVILPQAIRTVLPPLGNDFISLLKDSALVSAISVKELTLWTRQRSANTFKPLEHWTIAAILYLVMTLGLSVVVRYLERRYAIPK